MMSNPQHQPQKKQKDVSLELYKLHGVNQYVLYTSGQEVHFILEEDAQNFARKISGVADICIPVRER